MKCVFNSIGTGKVYYLLKEDEFDSENGETSATPLMAIREGVDERNDDTKMDFSGEETNSIYDKV